MKELRIDIEAEKKEILKRYRALLRATKSTLQKGDKRLIRKAFEMALESHKDMRRKSGEPYIYHPIAVAQIAAEEIGLGTTSVVCALLHDVVEDCGVSLESIAIAFGYDVASLVEELTLDKKKYKTIGKKEYVAQEALKMSSYALCIKLCDRLNNIMDMEGMKDSFQKRYIVDTLYLLNTIEKRKLSPTHKKLITKIKNECFIASIKLRHRKLRKKHKKV